MKHADIDYQEDKFIVSGDLHFSNVMAIYKKSSKNLSKNPVLEFDFSNVRSSDSAGIALIIEWIKFAKLTNKEIYFHSLSSDILQLARAAGLEKFIVETFIA